MPPRRTRESSVIMMLQAMVESAPIATTIVDADFRHLYANDAFAAIVRADRATLAGRRIVDVLPNPDAVASGLGAAAAGGVGDFQVAFAHTSDAARSHWVAIAFRLHTVDAPCYGVMMRDVTVRTQADMERQTALGEEQRSRQQAERERDFLRMVVQNAPMGISVCEGPEHRLALISDFALALLRTDRAALLEKPLAESFPDLFPLVRDTYERVYHQGETITLPERQYTLPDGRQIWTYACYAPVIGADRTPIGVMALSLDISELKRTQQIVESQKRVLEMMAEGQPLGVVLDAISNVVAERSSGSALSSVLLVSGDGTRLVHGAAPQLPPTYTAAVDGVPIGPEAGSCGTAAFRRERVIVSDVTTDPLWTAYRDVATAHGLHACWSTPIFGADETLLGTFAVYYPEPRTPGPEDLQLVDLLVPTAALAIERHRADGERQRLLEAERRARRAAEDANRSKDEFVAALSHELRTPLNAILGWTRILRAGELDHGEQMRALESIERNTRAQSQLVEDLLDISRIVAGKLRLDVRSVELSAVIDGAIDAVRPAAEAKNIRLQKVLDPRAAPISGDPDRLQQVVWNLLANAIKFTPKGGRVQIRLERVNSHVEILVSDTGAGIAADLLPRIFDRFQQGDSEPARTAGLGLGLAISRHLVELHGGTIQATSDGPGCGATFTVKLPLMVARDDRTPAEVHPTAPSGSLGASFPTFPFRIKIAVVEDDEDGREIVANILERAGAQVRTATSAIEGFLLVRDWQPDVLISDIEMPGEDGYTFIGRLRRDAGLSPADLPAVALTAYARVEDRIRALAAGFQMHVPKPVEPAELIAVVKSLAPQRLTEV